MKPLEDIRIDETLNDYIDEGVGLFSVSEMEYLKNSNGEERERVLQIKKTNTRWIHGG